MFDKINLSLHIYFLRIERSKFQKEKAIGNPVYKKITCGENKNIFAERVIVLKNISKEQYGEMVKQASPASPVVKDCVLAFFCGGTVCAIGQGLFRLYEFLGAQEKDARGWVALTLIAVAAILTTFGIYDRLAKHAGAGLVVPITGFSNSMVSSAIEYKSEGFVMGVGARLFTVAGPVLVFGITASVLYGLALFLFQLV